MKLMTENERKKIISNIQEFGGIGLRHQTIRVHKNGAKFPISKVYLDDELLNQDSTYTVILIPEIKLAPKLSLMLSRFARRFGPKPIISYPEETISEIEKVILAQNMTEVARENFFIQLSNIIPSTMNYYFEIHSEWARGNKEILLVSILVNNPMIPMLKDKIQEKSINFASKVEDTEGAFKAFYLDELDSFPKSEHQEIRKMNEVLKENLKELHKEIMLIL